MNSHKTKDIIRREALKRLQESSTDECLRLSRQLMDQLLALPEWQESRTICSYISMPHEVQTISLLQQPPRSKTITVVTIEHDVCIPVRWEPGMKLRKGHWGVDEPVESTPIPAEQIDLVLVPGVAFGEAGERLGRGLGFYDLFLQRLRAVRVGLAFECQIRNEIPMEHWDQRMDIIVTEKRIIRC